MIDFLLLKLRDADAAKQLFRKALRNLSHPPPRVINTDLAPICGAATPDLKKEGHFAAVAGTLPSPNRGGSRVGPRCANGSRSIEGEDVLQLDFTEEHGLQLS